MSELINKQIAEKAVVALDRNFHIYIHGNREKIEEGKDEKGKYIKLYYDEIRL